LVVTLSLLAALALDRVAISPLWRYLSDLDARIETRSAEVAEAEDLARPDPRAAARRDLANRRLRGDTEQGGNEFRRYLEAQAGEGLEVVSSAQISAALLPDHPDLRRVVYALSFVGEQDKLRQLLENFDASDELLRVGRRGSERWAA